MYKLFYQSLVGAKPEDPPAPLEDLPLPSLRPSQSRSFQRRLDNAASQIGLAHRDLVFLKASSLFQASILFENDLVTVQSRTNYVPTSRVLHLTLTWIPKASDLKFRLKLSPGSPLTGRTPAHFCDLLEPISVALQLQSPTPLTSCLEILGF